MSIEQNTFQRRPQMPKLGTIVAAWRDLDETELRSAFPGLRCFQDFYGQDRGWESLPPFCFRCGWTVPSPFAWNDSGGWLEKAHLHDHRFGGSNEPLNMVPMCAICHQEQPMCQDRAAGIAFVNTPSRFAPLLRYAQMVTDIHYEDDGRPGRDAVRKLLRAYAVAGATLAAAIEQGGESLCADRFGGSRTTRRRAR